MITAAGRPRWRLRDSLRVSRRTNRRWARGQVILSGALGPMQPVAAGDLVTASIGALGEVSCKMV